MREEISGKEWKNDVVGRYIFVWMSSFILKVHTFDVFCLEKLRLKMYFYPSGQPCKACFSSFFIKKFFPLKLDENTVYIIEKISNAKEIQSVRKVVVDV